MTDDTYDDRTGEVWNKVRAEWAAKAVNTFTRTTFGRSFEKMIAVSSVEGESDAYCGVQDLVNNIGHLCDIHGWDFIELLDRAKRGHEDEVDIEARAGDEAES